MGHERQVDFPAVKTVVQSLPIRERTNPSVYFRPLVVFICFDFVTEHNIALAPFCDKLKAPMEVL